MPLSLQRARVEFKADVRHALGVDGDVLLDHVQSVACDSTEIDLSPHKLRAIVTPAGHALGEITVTMRVHETDTTVVRVPLPALVDDDDAATVLYLKDDWPLMHTTFHVEHPRDDGFEVFLITEPR